MEIIHTLNKGWILIVIKIPLMMMKKLVKHHLSKIMNLSIGVLIRLITFKFQMMNY
jgi:hypothetical protein